MSVGAAAHLLKVGAKALAEPFLVGEESHAVAIGPDVVNDDERMFEVEVLDTQAQGLRKPQAASIEEAGHAIGCAVQVGEDAEAFVMAEVGLDGGMFPGAQGVQIAERDAEDFLGEEQ
ncbi:MAG: hypothetical protein ACUVS4_16325, partial [Chloroflexaceae bacterium]